VRGQEYWRARYRELRPSWQPSPTVYKQLVADRVGPTTALLDLGCGHSELLSESYRRCARAYGADTDVEALAHNSAIPFRAAAASDRLPFRDGSFDLVALAWVLEHLDMPDRAFREIHRVLKPGGSLAFVTPNTWNYNVWAIRLVPNRLHGRLTRRLYGRAEHDTYPTRYRINSVRRIHALLVRIGFDPDTLILNGDPSYISFNEPLFRVARGLERILDLPWFQRTRVHIIGSYRKRNG
jgi:SAM-dependent methyltransferase